VANNFRRRLKFTRQGKYFVALTLGIGLAAINTGNNLLYLILGMLLAMIVASGILSEIAIAKLRVERDPPRRLFAHDPFLMGLMLANQKRRLASFSVELEDMAASGSVGKKCYFLKLPPGRSQKTSYRHTAPRRGIWRLDALRLATRFPFGLFEKSRLLAAPQELVVFPTVRPLSRHHDRRPGGDEAVHGRVGRRGEYHGLREYRPGDDPRDMAWRASARARRLLVREYEDPTGQRVTIYLDNGRESATESPERLVREEAAVSYAASLASHYSALGCQVSLLTRTLSIPAGHGSRHLDRILRALALIEFCDAPDCPEAPAVPSDGLRLHPAELPLADVARFGGFAVELLT
jgi:uncharacterized protein (DUF58 family)